ncbi:MAG: SPOR domain-containing protein [Novosphingobium sp.]|nr:SPOR domain-containing protein [Novosphingobium sp.]
MLFAAPLVQPVTLAALERPSPRVVSDAPAFASVPVPAARPAPAAATPRTVGKFVAERGQPVKPGKGKGLVALLPKPVASGSHWVQLGSYTDPAVAGDGWGKFTRRTPALKGFPRVTTTATVDGVAVWRVAAAGFASYNDAAKMCAAVKQRGGACLVKRAEAGPGSPARLARR